MLSVNDMFYNEQNEPVLVVDDDRSRSHARRGYLSRQDSRNFRSSASPPPSRVSNHTSSWYGHRKSSQSPTRGRHYGQTSEYSDYRSSRHGRSPERSSWFGSRRRDSQSPRRSSYHEGQPKTMFKEDYTGYPAGYTAEGYPEGYRSNSVHGYEGSRQGYGYDGRSTSSTMYHGQHTATVPRTYETPYGTNNYYPERYPESVKLRVPLCCEACEERITNHMLSMQGVESVTCDQKRQKVTVRGTASPAAILKQGKECFKQTTFY